jgi:hypothetical protein
MGPKPSQSRRNTQYPRTARPAKLIDATTQGTVESQSLYTKVTINMLNPLCDTIHTNQAIYSYLVKLYIGILCYRYCTLS